ncbi:unnamed protein product, partial [Ectocarpus fasciculatus]
SSGFSLPRTALRSPVATKTYTTSSVNLIKTMQVKGGQTKPAVEVSQEPSFRGKVLGTWGVISVLLMLGNAVKRLLPVALQPFTTGDFTQSQWAMYISWGLFMSYAEGFKGFHQKFSPLVVRRAFTLEENLSVVNVVFAFAYSMGLYFATKKRMVISWSITAGVMTLVMIVKNLAYPWRSIVDGGVVAGLTIGSLSIVYHYINAMFGKLPDIDGCFVPAS